MKRVFVSNRPVQAGAVLLLAASILLCGPAMAAGKAGTPTQKTESAKKEASLPLQKLDKNAPPSTAIMTPDSQLRTTPVSELEQKPFHAVGSVVAPQDLPLDSDASSEPEPEMTSVTQLQDAHIKPISYNKAKARDLKPMGYAPLEAIVIFPVIKHGSDKAFGDLPEMVAREFALKMEQKAPETRVLNPVYTVDEIRMRGLGHIYDKIMTYYIKTGRPEPLALDYLVNQLSADGRPVSRVMFVEADLDIGHPATPSSLGERFKAVMTDAVPSFMKYYVEGRVQVFDTTEPDCPMVWAFSRTKSFKVNEVLNVTPSVLQDSDSQREFAKVSRTLSRDVLLMMPKAAYMQPEYDLSVQGQVVSASQPTTVTRSPMGENTREALERILGQ